MKKLLTILFAIMLILCSVSLFACDNADNSSGKGNGTAQQQGGGAESGSGNSTDDESQDGDSSIKYIRVDENGQEKADGKYILFGSYPQTDVTDSMSSVLNYGTLPTNGNNNGWISYKYYIESSNANDFMWYKDITHNSEKYRAVYFTSYRPYYTKNDTTSTYQDDNGYNTNKAYLFKYEPIKWRIMQEKNGCASLLCEMIIDSQAYQNTYINENYGYYNNGAGVPSGTYVNNYKYSTIRAWLNDNFYNTAFGSLEKTITQTTIVDNSADTTNSSSNRYACENTNDKVYLLSYQEIINQTNGFDGDDEICDFARQKKTTDYTKAQGGYTCSNGDYEGNDFWFLRSPDKYYDFSVCSVDYDGRCEGLYSVYATSGGVVPALKIQL